MRDGDRKRHTDRARDRDSCHIYVKQKEGWKVSGEEEKEDGEWSFGQEDQHELRKSHRRT